MTGTDFCFKGTCVHCVVCGSNDYQTNFFWGITLLSNNVCNVNI